MFNRRAVGYEDTSMTYAHDPVPRAGQDGDTVGTVVRLAAAAAVLVGGLVHLQLYFDGYRNLVPPDPNLGRSFLLNGIASAVIAASLVFRRDMLVRLAAAGLLAGTLVAFVLTRNEVEVLGFTERGFNPSPQALLTLVVEILGLLLIAATFVPAIGAGRNLPLVAALPAAAAILLVTVIGSALWARTGTETAAAPPTTAAPATTAAPSTAAPAVTSAPETTTATSVAASQPPGAATTVAPTTTAAPATAVPATPAPAASGPTVVSIVDFAFEEQTLTIPVGTTVDWVNNDAFAHSVVAEDGSFASEDMAPGATFSFTFTTPGEFAYICGIHPSMLGTIVVTG